MSQHHRDQKWTSKAPKLRESIAAQLPLPCIDCGRAVTPDQAWQVGHRVPASEGGRPTRENTGPTHTRCNQRAGGRLGAAKTNGARASTRREANGLRAWW